jgi:hypothetical protein
MVDHYGGIMAGFVKLFSSIANSTIWREDPPTKIVWITMLVLADRDGYVGASIPGLADAARVSLEETEAALLKFKTPDPYSRTQDFEGRRIMDAPGGWMILNYPKYRAIRSEEERRIANANRVRRFREKHKTACNVTDVTDVTECNALSRPVTPSNAIAEAEAETETKKTKDSPPTPPQAGGKAPPEKKRKPRKPGLFPIDESTDSALIEAWLSAVEAYPTRDVGHNHKTGAWEERNVQRDSPQAQANFLAIARSGKATAEELYACAWVAASDWAKSKGEYQWIPNLATFYGPEKAKWLEYLTRARLALSKLETA